MKEKGKRDLAFGGALVGAFALWTALIQCVDVRPVGQNGTNIGFAGFNTWFHELTGAHMGLYAATDWLGLVPIAVCLGFGALGLAQLLKRRSLLKVDMNLILLGGYYVLVILAYLVFEMIPINYRPVLIDGVMEASYPSSTTLLVLAVMPTLQFQVDRRAARPGVKKAAGVFVIAFSAFMVLGRLVSGVHWFTDIAGAVFLSAGLFLLYRGGVALTDKR
ncbi:MAG: phosphatase PAP2 family protein [Oscillibacter sp.]|nr:phosphatase PAP2 family protein [Oscillibacter sp.]